MGAPPRQKVRNRDVIATASRIARQKRIFLFAILAGRGVFAVIIDLVKPEEDDSLLQATALLALIGSRLPSAIMSFAS
jgi:hypothetical protein